jgi:DNA-binding transcriptional MerR regulator
MEHKTLEEALENAVQKLMEAENAPDSADPCRYSKTVFAAFDRIQALREKGFRLVKICKALEESGLLPQNANPRCFCQALRREKARRGKNADSSIARAERRERCAGENAADKPDPVLAPDETAPKESEEGMIRRLTGTVLDTGRGKIIKHSDGSFEF